MATTDNFAMNTSLPFYPGENVTGAVLTLSQNPCNNPYKRNACCTPTHKAHNAHGHISYTCANWTGAAVVAAAHYAAASWVCVSA